MTLPEHIEGLVKAEHWNPYAILGPHSTSRDGTSATVVRTFAPGAKDVRVVLQLPGSKPLPMTQIHEIGLFEVLLPKGNGTAPYRIQVTDSDGTVTERHDPYAFQPLLTEFDLHLFAEGRLYKAYDTLGAHMRTVSGVTGVHFVVWAPNALRMSVVGDFNRWDGRCHQMTNCGATGLWELFIPDLPEGTIYKYEVRARNQEAPFLKADPYAFAGELRPRTASVVRDLSRYHWNDRDWMETRSRLNPLTAPMSIYEVHLGSWMRVPEEEKRWLTYRELADKLIHYVKHMGYTHVELMPITEHPFDGSWGYQATGYFAATCRFGPQEDFMAFVDAAHQAGIGVIIDWAPAHFPDDPHGLAWFDGTHLYDHEDPRLGYHPEWKSRIFNYGRVEVKNFLLNSALFWLDRYHIDGLRVDAVASMLYLDYGRKAGEWIPNQFGGNENLAAVDFLKELNVLVHQEHPGAITIAEESTAWPGVSKPTYTGGLGFTFKWNMGWMHDNLGSADESTQDAYRSFGHALGLAFQVQDDILGIWGDEAITGKSAASDLLEGKKSLPVLHGLTKGGKFAERWRQGPIKPSEVEEIAKLLASEGSYEYTHAISRQMTTMALDSLREADPQGEAGEALMELANKLIKREQ